MSATIDFYRTRAEESHREAEAALLDNVRDRCRRAEAAWTAMAERLARAEEMRERQVADKAGREQEPAA